MTEDTRNYFRPVRRHWMKSLAKELVSPYMRSRLQGPLPKSIKMNIRSILKDEEEDVEQEQKEGQRKRKRCGLCNRTGNKTFNMCALCSIPVCGKHSKMTCLTCLEDD
ncbi:hypothetical protein J6590_079310 [Homalodisca vitripennis]|nr:hypothetical protein J6590_079310 [Homalodisca vitripennis]